VWNLRSVGRGLSVLSSVQSQSEAALQELLAAQSALAGSDFEASEQSFAAADELLEQARGELDDALEASRYILSVIDVTGTVRSGRELLETGELLAEAGQHVSVALKPLIESPAILVGEEGTVAGDQSVSLVEAIRDGQVEVAAALINLEQVEGNLDVINSPFLPEDVKAQLVTLEASVPRAREILQAFHDQSDTYLHLLGEHQHRGNKASYLFP